MDQLLAGVVILYNPKDTLFDNLKTYASSLSLLYVIDNSEMTNELLINRIQHEFNVQYIRHEENMGIAYSLNKVLMLLQGKYKWLLTMDQDSKFYQNSLEEYVAELDGVDADVYGICPTYEHPERVGKENDVPGSFEVIEKCITSGNIINVNIAIKCGGFDEKLFIDEVDHDFCYRCNRMGYKLLKYKKNILLHSIGHPIYASLFGFQFNTLNENYIRQYYIIRNRLYIASCYPEKKKSIYIELFKWIIKIILAEPDKIKKLKFAFRGFIDFCQNKFGKIEV